MQRCKSLCTAGLARDCPWARQDADKMQLSNKHAVCSAPTSFAFVKPKNCRAASQHEGSTHAHWDVTRVRVRGAEEGSRRVGQTAAVMLCAAGQCVAGAHRRAAEELGRVGDGIDGQAGGTLRAPTMRRRQAGRCVYGLVQCAAHKPQHNLARTISSLGQEHTPRPRHCPGQSLGLSPQSVNRFISHPRPLTSCSRRCWRGQRWGRLATTGPAHRAPQTPQRRPSRWGRTWFGGSDCVVCAWVCKAVVCLMRVILSSAYLVRTAQQAHEPTRAGRWWRAAHYRDQECSQHARLGARMAETLQHAPSLWCSQAGQGGGDAHWADVGGRDDLWRVGASGCV